MSTRIQPKVAIVGLLTLLLAGNTADVRAKPLFDCPFVAFDVGAWPVDMAAGDVNQDGQTDLLVANFESLSISILIGHGDGTFSNGAVLTALNRPTSLALARLDADNVPELVVTHQDVNQISIFPGHADGTFGPRTDLDVGVRTASVRAGDFNGDGKQDLAIRTTANSILIRLGNGDGTLTARPTLLTAGSDPVTPNGLTLTDIDRNGRLDLVVCCSSASLGIFLGNGDGTFGPRADLGTRFAPDEVAVADLNGDTKLDLAVANQTGGISVFLGNGNGTYQPRTDVLIGGNSISIGCRDLNADGKPDLVTCGNNSITVYRGMGDGTFPTKQTFLAGDNPKELLLGDFNSDGLVDAAVINASGGRDVTIHDGMGDGTFGPPAIEVATPQVPYFLDTGDLNEDGATDIVVASTLNQQISFFAGNGDGHFAPRIDVPAGGTATSLRLADLDHDGHLDVVALISTVMKIYRGDGRGVISELGTYGLTDTPYGLAIGDLNHDGNVDVVVSGLNQTFVFLGRGDATFQPPMVSNVRGFSIQLSDLNGDGNLDLASIIIGSFSFGLVYFGAGDGSFVFHGSFPVTRNGGYMALGDFNEDGILDVSYLSAASPEAVGIDLGLGGGDFGPTTFYTVAAFPSFLTLLDADGDGHKDIAIGTRYADLVTVLFGDGQGSFDRRMDYGAGLGSYRVAAADFNRDGAVDLATLNQSSYTCSILLGHRDLPTPALASVLRAEASPGKVHLEWTVSGSAYFLASVERKDAVSEWTEVGHPVVNGMTVVLYDDLDVASGVRYGYRLRVRDAAGEIVTDPVWLSVPRSALMLAGVAPNPALRGPSIEFSLNSTNSAWLEVFNFQGRRVWARDLTSLGPGNHRIELTTDLGAGAYLLRLSQDGIKSVCKMTIVR